jgi:large subunit ribosomal protein L13e
VVDASKERSKMTALRPKIVRTGGKQRSGRGFSREELKKAGTDFKEALRLKIAVDLKRKTAHDENVEAVKTFLKSEKPKLKPKLAKKEKSKK